MGMGMHQQVKRGMGIVNGNGSWTVTKMAVALSCGALGGELDLSWVSELEKQRRKTALRTA